MSRNQMLMFEDDRFYSDVEIAAVFGGKTSRVTIWRWAREGVLPKPRKLAPNTSRWVGAELNAAVNSEGE